MKTSLTRSDHEISAVKQKPSYLLVVVTDALTTCSSNVFLSILRAIFPGGPGLAGTRMSPFWILLELRMMEVVSGGDNWSYKTCKSPVKSSPSTNQHPTIYRPVALPVTQPTLSKP